MANNPAFFCAVVNWLKTVAAAFAARPICSRSIVVTSIFNRPPYTLTGATVHFLKTVRSATSLNIS